MLLTINTTIDTFILTSCMLSYCVPIPASSDLYNASKANPIAEMNDNEENPFTTDGKLSLYTNGI